MGEYLKFQENPSSSQKLGNNMANIALVMFHHNM